MDSPHKDTVALSSKTQAEQYFERRNYGRAFAHTLLALKLCGHWKEEMKNLFTSSLCKWGEELEAQQRYNDLFNCYEQALDVFPENEEVTSNLGAHLFRLGCLREASHYFKLSLKINPNYLPAYFNLQYVSNALVERWHFRMLNDSYRNEAYREAVLKKVGQGFDFVLDIGTGTGLLSFFAVSSGSKNVYACDYSQTMIDMAYNIAESIDMEFSIKFICKLSNDLNIPDDIPRRVSLVVTETIDAGLFGERLLQTLIHAWENLLLPPLPPVSSFIPPVPCINCRDLESCRRTRRNGIVVPFSASLWLAAVECNHIAQKYLVLNERKTFTNKFKIPFQLLLNLEEPYDTENLRTLKSMKLMCEPIKCFHINFNDVDELKNYVDGKFDDKVYKLISKTNGYLHSFVTWFDLYLDEDIKLTSSPFVNDDELNSCCWDQAVFPCQTEFLVSPGTKINVYVKTKDGKLSVKLCDTQNSWINKSDFHQEFLHISQDSLRFLNNTSLVNSLLSSVNLVKTAKSILDFSPFPVLGFELLVDELSDVDLYVFVSKSECDINAVKKLLNCNGINNNKLHCFKQGDFESSDLCGENRFDIIITNLIDSTGDLKETSINQLTTLRKLLKPDGQFWPRDLKVWGQLIHSDWLKKSVEVIDKGLVQKYNIAYFMNEHKVTQHMDLCLSMIEHCVLSEEFEITQFSMNDLITKSPKTFNQRVRLTGSKEVTALVCWFKFELYTSGEQLSTRNISSHINQVAIIIEPKYQAVDGNYININGKCSESNFMFSLSL